MGKIILEGSRAIALTVKNIGPAVVSAYPITPQTHIVEDLAHFKADSDADYEYVRAESEFAAASIVAGASATGVRVYTATSSQGLLLMNEVLYNIAGMRLPVVMTCANRGVSAPITIWNDHQDAMSVRDAGWIMFFAENLDEAVCQHIMAYKIAEKLKLPVIINVDGFILTHVYEPVNIPDAKLIAKYLPFYKPTKGEYLDPSEPITMGAFATPAYYMEIREALHNDLLDSQKTINEEYVNYHKIINSQKSKISNLKSQISTGLIEYYGPKNAKTIIVAMGSVIGTIKDTADELNKKTKDSIGVLKIKTFRPFPADDIIKTIKNAKEVLILEKALSLGNTDGILGNEIKSAAYGKIKAEIKNFVIGLGGRDITKEMVKKIIREKRNNNQGIKFVGK